MSGSVNITCSNGKAIMVWITRDDQNTQLSDGQQIAIEKIKENDPCLFTVMQKDDSSGGLQICPLTSLVVSFKKCETGEESIKASFTCGCCTFQFTTKGVTVEQRQGICQDMQSTADEAAVYQRAFLKKRGLSFKSHVGRIICNPHMLECDWVLNGKYNPVSAVSGWPQCARTVIDPIHFARAVTYACIVLNADVAHLNAHCKELPKNIADVLISCTLTAFAGNYPDCPEIVDDRSPSELKFGYNRDCDDMAITVVAVFNYLKSVNQAEFCKCLMGLTTVCGEGIPAIACKIMCSMMSRYKTAAAIICQAVPHIAIPNSDDRDGDLIGHVFAIISPNKAGPDLMKGACLIESTRMSSPTNLAIPAYHVGGKQAFPRKTVYEIGQPGIQCVKPFNARQYPECISGYTQDQTFLFHNNDNVIGVHIEDLLNGTAHTLPMTNVPKQAQYPAICRRLSHRPAYSMMDAACEQYGWKELLAHNATVNPLVHMTDADWMVTGGMKMPEVLKLSNFTTYAFMTESGVCAKVK